MATYSWPTQSVTATNPSVSSNGATAPASSTLVGGIDSGGDLQGLLVDNSGNLQVAVADSVLPTGAATEAKQDTGNASLSSIDGKTPALVTGRVPVDGSGVTQPVSGTVTANAGTGTFAVSGTVTANAGTGTFAVSAASLPLPTGAATSANQSTANTSLSSIDGKLPSALGQKTMANSLGVVIASDQSAVPASQSGAWSTRTQDGSGNSLTSNTAGSNRGLHVSHIGRSVVTTVRNDYTSTSVTTGAWVQLVSSTSAQISELEIFDSSGQTLELGTGASSSETRLILIFPGGNGRVPVNIAASTRLSIRAVSATASVGELDINAYGV